jgi:hypothetical protein
MKDMSEERDSRYRDFIDPAYEVPPMRPCAKCNAWHGGKDRICYSCKLKEVGHE